MDFIPHTPQDDREMLARIGMESLEDLFEPIPAGVRLDRPLDVQPSLSEPELLDHLRELAGRGDGAELTCFAGGGAYDHHLPPVVKALAGRAEFATSYTPYQPELSQGVLQALFEFQSMICKLYGMEVANASLYDGAHALVEAVNLAVRVTGRTEVAVGETIHPHYLEVLKTYTSGLGIMIRTVPHTDGVVEWSTADLGEVAAVAWAYPNFFGRLEDGRAASERAASSGALSIAVADPAAMGILASPGSLGADVAVGEGHALGNPMSYGGPYVGLFATTLKHVRQVPGRISGQTLDADGRRAYVLTLQAREQHIRRAKATSNVCTNQTLMAIAAAIQLAWLGPVGLQRLGEVCARRTAHAARVLSSISGCSVAFDGPRFKELVLEVQGDASELASRLARRGFLVGPSLERWWPELKSHLLIAVTERRTEDEIARLAEAIEKELTEA